MSKPLIEVSDVSKSFDGKELFEDLNLSINEGEFVIITGESGCGKTTLLNIIGGLELVSSGNIVVNGLNITELKNLKRYYRDTVGFVFQNFALVEQKTVKENLEMVHPKGKTNIGLEEVLESVGLKGTLTQKVYSLSGGEQQRIALARLRLKNCKIILADEPTGSLDKKNGNMVMKILHKLNQEGKTVLMVTHDESLIEEGDRLIKL